MRLLLLGCVLLLSIPFMAWSQQESSTILPPTNDGLAESFRKADRNSDGSLTIEEANQGGFGLSETFAAVDTDRSGTITLFELGEALQRKLGDWTTADTDGDGEVSEAEAKKGSVSLLNALLQGDTNADHQLSRTEYESYNQRQIYRNVEMPSVYPNIIDKKF